jgi:erythronate-4-phosphate dehydrogenase
VLLIDDQIPLLASVLDAYDDVQIVDGRALSSRRDLLTQAEALIIRSTTRVAKELIADTPIRFIASATAGIDHVDTLDLAEAGITFSHAPGSNANAVAEYVVCAMLEWSTSLQNRTIGVIGVGHVGSLVATYAQLLGMRVLVNDPPLIESGRLLPWTHASLERIVEESNVVTVHVPFEREGMHPTYRLLNADLIGRLRDHTLLLNTSRGDIVDEGAAHRRMQRLDVVLDVWRNEPQVNPLVVADALIATPHIAGYSVDAKLNGARMVADAYVAWKNADPAAIADVFSVDSERPRSIPFADATALRSLLRARRPIAEHSYAFKEAYAADPTAETFDTLRKRLPLSPETLRI